MMTTRSMFRFSSTVHTINTFPPHLRSQHQHGTSPDPIEIHDETDVWVSAFGDHCSNDDVLCHESDLVVDVDVSAKHHSLSLTMARRSFTKTTRSLEPIRNPRLVTAKSTYNFFSENHNTEIYRVVNLSFAACVNQSHKQSKTTNRLLNVVFVAAQSLFK
jgi:hypothetical protein